MIDEDGMKDALDVPSGEVCTIKADGTVTWAPETSAGTMMDPLATGLSVDMRVALLALWYATGGANRPADAVIQ